MNVLQRQCFLLFPNLREVQLLEPYTGKLSEEVDDVDDDGPRISLRWLYTPDELPRHFLLLCALCFHELCALQYCILILI